MMTVTLFIRFSRCKVKESAVHDGRSTIQGITLSCVACDVVEIYDYIVIYLYDFHFFILTFSVRYRHSVHDIRTQRLKCPDAVGHRLVFVY